jgi:hypothetical protein
MVADLEKHARRVHSNIDTHACKTCGEVMESKNALRAHMADEHGKQNQLHRCEFCNKPCFTKLRLNKHRAVSHGKIFLEVIHL